MNIDRLFSALNLSARGLAAQRKRMNAIAENIANASTTRTENGDPYRRKTILMSNKENIAFRSQLQTAAVNLARTHQHHFPSDPIGLGSVERSSAGVTASEGVDPTPFNIVYDPSHPDADDQGYVRTPNVNIVTEMVDMMMATRAYEANTVAINATKTMAKDSLEI